MIETLCVFSLIFGILVVIHGIITIVFHIDRSDEDDC